MKDVQSIIIKQNSDDSRRKRNLLIRKKKAAKMSAYKITSGIVFSLFATVISVVGLLALCAYSAVNKGNAGFFVGVIGLVLFVINIAGFIIGVLERKNDDAKSKYVIAGIVSNLVLIIFYIILYWIG